MRYRERYPDREREQRQQAMDLARFGASRAEILARLGDQCAICGGREDLHIHHVDCHGRGGIPNNDPGNLMLLCASHHHKVHAMRARILRRQDVPT